MHVKITYIYKDKAKVILFKKVNVCLFPYQYLHLYKMLYFLVE